VDERWLTWPSKGKKQTASLKLPTAMAHALPSIEKSDMTRK